MRNTSITYEQLLKDAKRWRKQNPHLTLQQAQDEVAKKAGYATLYEAHQVLLTTKSTKNDPRTALIERLKRQCGQDYELYYFCRALMYLGVDLPSQIGWPTIQPLIDQQPSLLAKGYRMIDMKEFLRITGELKGSSEDEGEEADDSTPLIGDDYTGVVSFRSEGQVDIDALMVELNKSDLLVSVSKNSKIVGNNELRVKSGETFPIPDCQVEWTIRSPLTIRRLFDAMNAVVDGHVMAETLRALPLSQNSLERRFEDAAPENWATNETL
ncbi:hypothetical protein [Ralstonia pseudosolanacearum]|uniref:hypothetical protein n=1 Tax=Ralstonia pseudosolanacearum TaxID=1310165 RepID=UPI003CF50917